MLSAEQLQAFQGFAEPLFNTPIDIHRSDPTTLVVGVGGYDPSTDYGDDESPDPDADDSSSKVGTANGWLFSHLQPDSSDSSGQIVTLDIHEIRFAVGTDIRAQDVLVVVASNEKFVAIDTNGDDTWADMLRVTVRRRE